MEIEMRRFIFTLIILLCMSVTGAVYGEVWQLKFDFGSRAGYLDNNSRLIIPPSGYLYVDPYPPSDPMDYGDQQIVYPGQPIDGADYGFVNNDTENVSISNGNSSSWATIGSTTNLALTFVRFSETHYENTAAGAFFELQVPNGDYVVTVGGGRAERDGLNRMEVEGNVYRGDDLSSTNLYILDVAPDDPNDSPVLTWTLDPNLVKHAPLDGNGSITTWGSEPIPPDPNSPAVHNSWEYMEILCLYREVVTVSDGRLTVHGSVSGDNIGYLNFLEVVPNNCEAIVAAGYSFAGDMSGDCEITFEDYAMIAEDWMHCNDPTDESCIKKW